MRPERDSRKLTMLSLVVAFVLGVGFGLLGARLRPQVALAPGPLPEPKPEPTPVAPAKPAALGSTPHAMPGSDSDADSVPGNGTSDAPEDYPIKGNERSGIYHAPGGFAYDRTVATVYFRSAEAAEAAGYRASRA